MTTRPITKYKGIILKCILYNFILVLILVLQLKQTNLNENFSLILNLYIHVHFEVILVYLSHSTHLRISKHLVC